MDHPKRRTPFDFEGQGVKRDPNKSYRWVTKNRVDERKSSDGYSFYKGQTNASDGTFQARGMILMERPREMEEKSTKYKEYLTRAKSQATRSMLEEEAERLSSKHGRNLHKNFIAESDDD